MVFLTFLFVCLLLVKLEAVVPYAGQAPAGISSTAQTVHATSSWILRPQNLSFPGSSTFGNRRPLHKSSGRLVAAAESAGDSGKIDSSTTNNRFDDSKPFVSDETSSNVEIMTSIWKVQHGIPVLTRIDDYKKFESHSCYFIFRTPIVSEEEPALTELYYWIGNQSSHEDAATTAGVAMLNKYVYKDFSIKLHREAEGQESLAFKALFKSYRAESISNVKAYEQTDINRRKIFVIEGKNNNDGVQEEILELDEVELPLAEVLRDERSCFVFVLDKVYVSCGIRASVRPKLGARELAKIMMKRKGLKDEEVKTYRTDILFTRTTPEGENLFKFFKEFEHLSQRMVKQHLTDKSEEFTRKELRKILDQTVTKRNGKEWFNIRVTRLFENIPGDGVVQEEKILPDNLLPLILEYHTKDCLLVDSKSNIGLFVWMGKDVATQFGVECAHRAELYLRKKEYYYANRITFVHQEDLPLEVETVQRMIEFLITNDEGDEDRSSGLSLTAEDSSQEFDYSSKDDNSHRQSLDAPKDRNISSPQNEVRSNEEKLSFENRTNKEKNHEEAMERLKLLLQPAESEITNQYDLRKDGLTFDQLVELLEYSKSHTGDELCKVMDIQASQIEVILSQIKTLHTKVQNRSIRNRLTRLSSKLKQIEFTPFMNDNQK